MTLLLFFSESWRQLNMYQIFGVIKMMTESLMILRKKRQEIKINF